ncbi:hypothetical protein BDY21DRAFT_367541 [Lineolata rhizophorae]|uniref:Uncharacterized protein n=1 Tax=Lineolata rhizophorae TaxID=578093 RepID=A0A6A6NLY2_9PEZI|nr:hypothetical protein BDY21DRAFT_367541 [Lineolata rhizophorae]
MVAARRVNPDAIAVASPLSMAVHHQQARSLSFWHFRKACMARLHPFSRRAIIQTHKDRLADKDKLGAWEQDLHNQVRSRFCSGRRLAKDDDKKQSSEGAKQPRRRDLDEEHFETWLRAIQARIEKDPYDALFGWQNDMLTGPKEPFATEATTAKPAENSASSPAGKGGLHIHQADKYRAPEVLPRNSVPTQAYASQTVYEYDPISNRMIEKDQKDLLPQETPKVSKNDGGSGEVPVKAFKPKVVEEESALESRTISTRSYDHIPEHRATSKDFRDYDTDPATAQMEESKQTESEGRLFQEFTRVETTTKSDPEQLSQAEQKLAQSSENPRSDFTESKTRRPNLPPDDIDLLSAGDIRARMGIPRKVRKESSEEKQAIRTELEQEFNKIQNETSPSDSGPREVTENSDIVKASLTDAKKSNATPATSSVTDSAATQEAPKLETALDRQIAKETVRPCEGEGKTSSVSASSQIPKPTPGENRRQGLGQIQQALRHAHLNFWEIGRMLREVASMNQDRVKREAANAKLTLEIQKVNDAMSKLMNRHWLRENEQADASARPTEGFKRWEPPSESPEALAAKQEQKEKDAALVREIRDIYEQEYGAIDVKHRQQDPTSEETSTNPPAGKRSTASNSESASQPSDLASSVQAEQPIVAKSTTKPTDSSSTPEAGLSEPNHYTVLAYDPSTDAITSVSTSSYPIGSKESKIPLPIALSKLSRPAKFLPYLPRQTDYEIVSNSPNLLVIKQKQDPNTKDSLETALPASEETSIAPQKEDRQTATGPQINPIDGTTAPLFDLPPSQAGNFASPTGFVNHDSIMPSASSPPPPPTSRPAQPPTEDSSACMHEADATAERVPDSRLSSRPHYRHFVPRSGSHHVRREERIFTGGRRSWRAHERGNRKMRRFARALAKYLATVGLEVVDIGAATSTYKVVFIAKGVCYHFMF